jgi:hypothetical protein
MKNLYYRFSLIAAVLAGTCVIASAAQPANSGEAVFKRYVALERAFDPATADLYCDSALIRNVRKYPDGQERTMELPAPKYKELIRSAMPLAKAKGDTNKYTNVVYAPEGLHVRITADRYSEMKKYSSPLSLLVGRCNGGDWAVLEEISQSRP